MANDRHPVLVTIFDQSGRKKITSYDDSMWGWPNEESVTDYVMSYPAKKYPDHVVEVMPYSERSRGDLPLTAESLRWRFRTGRVAGQTSVRLLRKSRTAALHHATKKKSSAQLDREIAAFLQSRGHAPNMPHAIPDRGYMVAQHGGGTYLSSFGSKDEAVRFARGLAKQTREAYDIVKVQNRGEDRFIVDEVAPPGRSRSHATIGSHPLRSPEEDMLIAMLQGQLEEGEVFRNFFASGGKKRQRWLRALDSRSFDQLDELRRRAAAYGTAAGKELGSAIVDILAMRRSQGRGR